MSMTIGTPFDTSVKTLQNRVYEMSGCTSCLQTICPGIPIVWGRYVRVYELSLDQMSKQTKCQGVRNVMGVRNVLLPIDHTKIHLVTKFQATQAKNGLVLRLKRNVRCKSLFLLLILALETWFSEKPKTWVCVFQPHCFIPALEMRFLGNRKHGHARFRCTAQILHMKCQKQNF